MISTLEKRYDIRSGLSSIIPSSYEMGNLFTVMFVSYLGTRRHIPLWMGIGVLMMAAGSFLFAVPHFMTADYRGGSLNLANSNFSDLISGTICHPTYPMRAVSSSILDWEAYITFQQNHHLKKENVFSNCNSKAESASNANSVYMIIFVCAQVLMGGGGSPIFTLGTAYVIAICDRLSKQNLSKYM